MTIILWLVENIQKLQEAGVDSPRRDCLVFLEDTLEKNRAWVISHPEHKLPAESIKTLKKLMQRRIDREPLAYIRGKAWFYGRVFTINSNVLIPRPESEDFIEIIKEIRPSELVDVGTGSGCLSVTAKLELPNCSVFAYDIDEKCLEIAQKNAENYRVNILFKKSDLLQNITNYKVKPKNLSKDNSSVLVANLPYVPQGLVTSPEITREPVKALFSGKDGLDHYRKFWKEISKLLYKPHHILTESLENQHSSIEKFAEESGYSLVQTKGLIQHFNNL